MTDPERVDLEMAENTGAEAVAWKCARAEELIVDSTPIRRAFQLGFHLALTFAHFREVGKRRAVQSLVTAVGVEADLEAEAAELDAGTE